MQRIRLLLVDDHALFREGLSGIFKTQPDFEVVGEASDGLEALVMARELAPDLILMDISMPGGDGLETMRQIKQEMPAVTVVMLTVCDEGHKVFEAIRDGAQGYLLKSMHSQEMLKLLRGAVRGEAALTPALAGLMLGEFHRYARIDRPSAEDTADALTCREQEVLRLAAQGATDKEIADALTLSLHTVKSHMRNILSKLHVSSRHQAARYASPGSKVTAA